MAPVLLLQVLRFMLQSRRGVVNSHPISLHMSKSTKSKSPAAPRVKKTAAPKKAAVKKAAAAKKPAAPAKKKSAPAKAKAPAKKTAVKKATAVKKTAAPQKVAAKKTVAKKAPVKKTVAQKAPAKQKAVAKKKTVITARIDIAFGNTLYLRGEGPGLSWDAGVPMNSIGADEWSITLPDSKSQVIFKFLVNDISWNTGEDYVADSGSGVVLVPSF